MRRGILFLFGIPLLVAAVFVFDDLRAQQELPDLRISGAEFVPAADNPNQVVIDRILVNNGSRVRAGSQDRPVGVEFEWDLARGGSREAEESIVLTAVEPGRTWIDVGQHITLQDRTMPADAVGIKFWADRPPEERQPGSAEESDEAANWQHYGGDGHQ